MQYVWQHRLWQPAMMMTVDGRRVSVLDPGRLNTDAGPDFFNAKVRIDGHVWAGDVEIHVRASDWHRHHHDGDPAYDSVILHVVDYDDAMIRRSDGEVIPQLRMPCAPEFHRLYSAMVSRSDIDLPCGGSIAEIPPIYMSDWMSALAYERLYAKTDRISGLLDRLAGDWESVCYVTVARALGFGINGDPFERLALSVPRMMIGKHRDSLLTVEALLLGQSGLLPESGDSYSQALKREYEYMAHKFGMRAPQSLGWKMARMRPANFPQRRIALLAALMTDGNRLMSRVLEVRTPDDAARLLNPPMSEYWKHHYTFGPASERACGAMSRTSVNGLIINAIVPLMFGYGQAHDDPTLTDRAIDLLSQLPPESNSLVEMFARAGLKADNAMTSQALIQLRRAYCETHKCLYCRIGHRLLASGATLRR